MRQRTLVLKEEYLPVNGLSELLTITFSFTLFLNSEGVRGGGLYYYYYCII